jgi:selenocysteine-specific elongation factor
VRLLGSTELTPGETGWIQLSLAVPAALAKEDRFILRYPSPGQTIGGGKILDPHPLHRWRRFKQEVLARFEALSEGTPEDIILQILESQVALNLAQIAEAMTLPARDIEQIIQSLAAKGQIISLANQWLLAPASWNRVANRMLSELEEYHRSQPLQIGMPREALRSKMKLDSKLFNVLIDHLVTSGTIVKTSTLLHLSGHVVQFTEAQEKSITHLLMQIKENPASQPHPRDMATTVGEEVLQALLDRGDLIQLNEDVIMDAGTLSLWYAAIRHHLEEHETITVAEVRDLFSTSRKYALGILEYLDGQGVTRRTGDERVLRGSSR